MLGWRLRTPAAAIAGIGLGIGLMTTVLVPWVEAQTPAQREQAARKAYEEHMRRMDEAEKAAAAKPATPPAATTPPPAAAAPPANPPAAPKVAAPANPAPGMSQADQDAATERGLEQYRRMMKEDPWSNPALLDADRGEALWAAKKGPRNVSLAETCDLGKGVG
ncbi:MAG: hypothetical protein J0I75_25855, partial [Hyphomicrobium sp.]|nr:hypothetical protein [Hyphomicrobium sp.]